MLRQMLSTYQADTLEQRKNALREIAQEIVLCGLARAGFFQKAAFYGGTALRIFHDIDRFSEDMDFSLVLPDATFSLESYLPALERECAAWGLRFEAKPKRKTTDSAIQSAFLKGNTQEHLVTLFSDDGVADALAPGELLRIKVEVDTDPAPGATFEHAYRLLPSPYEAQLYDMPSLFAGKLHAVLCRSWKSRVKGRDLYDYLFYRAMETPVNLAHLQAKLVQTGHMDEGAQLGVADVVRMLEERFDAINFGQAADDVRPFLRDGRSLEAWSPALFKATASTLQAR